MANDLKLLVSAKLQKSGSAMKHEFTPALFSIAQTGSLVYDVISSIGTTEETLGSSFGDIGTKGLCILQNLDVTNYVQWGFSTTVYGGKLFPYLTTGAGFGVPAIWMLNSGVTIYIKANTAACNVRCIVYEI